MKQDPKHISQLEPARKAMMQQHIQEALLAICVQQGHNISIPTAVLDDVAANYALKIEVVGDNLVLSPQKWTAEIITPANLHRH